MTTSGNNNARRRALRLAGLAAGAVLGGLALGFGAGPAAAEVQSEAGSVTLTSLSSTQPVALDQFDPTDGSLDRITVTVAVDAAVVVEVTNLTAAPKATTVTLDATASLDGPGIADLEAAVAETGSEDLDPDDAFTFELDGASDAEQVLTDASVFAEFVGTGTVTFDVTGLVGLDVEGPATWRSTGSTDATATVTIEYDFTPAPAPTTTTTSTSTTSTTVPNTPPTAEDDEATVDEDDPATAIDVLANDTDPEDDPITVVSVTDPANGTAVLTAGGDVTYEPDSDYCNDPPGTTPDTFDYTLDGGSTATVSVTVTCVADVPVANDDTATVDEDSGATTIGVLANDVDPDPVVMTVASVTQPGNGTAVLTAGGDVTYEPDADYCNDPPGTTPDTFDYTLAPGGSTATVSVTVTCVDDPPTAVADTATVDEDDPATTIDVLDNDTDPDGDASIDSVTQPANGTAVLTVGGDVTYEPDPDYCNDPPGTTLDTFDYTINGGATATVTVTVTCVDDPPTAVDDSATVDEDDPATTIDVLANDTNADGGPLTVDSVTQPGNATVVITGGGSGLTYEPDANYCNDPPGTTPDTFDYTLNGGSTATVTVSVSCVADDPVANDDSATVAEDSTASTIDVLANDVDPDLVGMLIDSITDPDNGTVAITNAGADLTYEPDPDYCNDPPGTTPDTFDYTLAPGGSTATVSVTVTCVDDPPTAVDDTATVVEDDPATTVDVLANDTDVDGGTMTVESVTQPANGTAVLTVGGDVTYEPDPDYCNDPPGTTLDTFDYTLNGGSTATVTVTVTCVDDPPTAVDDSATVAEDAAATMVDVLANDTDPDGGPITVDSVTQPASGTVVVTGAGADLTYTPDANYCNDPPGTTPDTFDYTLAPGGSTATVEMTVTCVDDPATVVNSAGPLVYTENAPATAVDPGVTIVNPDALTVTAASVSITTNFQSGQDVLDWIDNDLADGITEGASTAQAVLLTGSGSSAEYTAALAAVTYRNSSDNPSTLARTVTFSITAGADSSDTIQITVAAVDDPPTAVDDGATLLEDAAATAIPVLANDTDVDAGPIAIGTVTQPTNGAVVITGGGTGLTYQPDPNYCNDPPGTAPDTFTYTLAPGGSTASVSVTVTCVNDAPVADDETFSGADSAVGNTALIVDAPPDGPPTVTGPRKSISGDILAGDTDIDGPGPLVVTAGTFASNDGGSVTIQADGDFTFLPAAGTSCTDASDFFDYTVTDQNPVTPGTDTGRVTIAITGCVWYVSNNAPGSSGTSTAPFDTVAQADTATPAGDVIFVFDGDNTTTGYTSGVDLAANQRLIGEAADLVVAGATLHVGIPANRPTITDNNADVVVLDDGNTVTGLDVNPQGTGGGIAGGSGDVAGTIADVGIVDAAPFGTEPGLELDATSGTWNISDLTVNTNGATGVRLNSAGTVNFAAAGTISITTAGAKGLDAAGAATNFGPGSVFDAITVTASGTGGVSLTGTTGTLGLGDGASTDLSLTTTSGATAAFFSSHAGALTVAAGGTDNVSASGGPAVDIASAGGIFEFDDVSSTNSTTDGINIDGLGTGTFTAATGTITGAAGIAVDVNGGSGTITYPGNLNNGTGQTAEITNRTGGAITLAGAVNDTADAGGGIALSGNTGGSTVLSSGTKTLNTGASDAVSVTTSNGHTLTLSGGGLDIDTTGGRGLHADDSGTLVVSGANNTIDSTTGIALNVVTTDIGAGGLTLRSIAANGAPSGIVLNTTGTAGGLTVTGSGSTTQGGDFSGGTIQGTTGHGIALTNTTGPSFRNSRLVNTGGSGVNGTQVNGFSFIDGTINGAGDASDENSITFDDSLTTTANLTGVVTITNNVISQTEAEGIDILNFAGTISNATISGNALSDTGDVATPGTAVSLIASGTPTTAGSITRATVANNTITDFRAGAGIQVRAGNVNAGGPAGHAGIAGSATDVIAITGNLMNGGSGGVGNQPDRFFTGGAAGIGQGNFNISNNGTAANRIRNIDCIAIELQADGPVTMTSTVQNNFINANSAVGCAGIAVGTDDPFLPALGAGTHTTLISGNNVMGTDGAGIFPIVRNSGSSMTARVLNNVVAAPITTNAARAGILVHSGSTVGDTTLCLEISGNITAGSTNVLTGTTSPGINLRKQGTDPTINTFGIEGLAPSPTGTPNVENHVNALNTSTPGTFGVGGTALLSAQTGFTSCTAP